MRQEDGDGGAKSRCNFFFAAVWGTGLFWEEGGATGWIAAAAGCTPSIHHWPSTGIGDPRQGWQVRAVQKGGMIPTLARSQWIQSGRTPQRAQAIATVLAEQSCAKTCEKAARAAANENTSLNRERHPLCAQSTCRFHHSTITMTLNLGHSLPASLEGPPSDQWAAERK
jgi:hypothetical protein